MLKKILIILIIVLIGVQFIRPSKNLTTEPQPNSADHLFPMSENLKTVMQKACLDCHSNNTNYPWYSNIQPMAWMMARHINNGKNELNFSDFGSYTDRRQISKLKGIANQIKDDEMPIASYKMMHKNARLSKEQKDLIMDWMNKTADSLSANY